MVQLGCGTARAKHNMVSSKRDGKQENDGRFWWWTSTAMAKHNGQWDVLFVLLFAETIQRRIAATADDNGRHTAVFSKFPKFATNTWEN